MEPHKIILFDGVCNLCNRTIQFVIKQDKKDAFRFATLQSDIGQNLCKERHINTAKIDSVVLIDPGKAYYTKSTAVLEIAKTVGGIWSIASVFQWLPEKLRDIVYDLVARRRYRWFGKKETCVVPTPELLAKFLDS